MAGSTIAAFGTKHDVRELPYISVLFEGKDKCGVYRLSFSDGEAYVGQSRNVVGRFRDHRTKWGDEIEYFEFAPVAPEHLNAAEYDFIAETEKTTPLRNKVHAKRPGGLGTMTFNFVEGKTVALPWKRSQRLLPEQAEEEMRLEAEWQLFVDRKTSKAWKRWAPFEQRPDYDRIVEVLGWYVRETIPDPINTAGKLWTMSVLPSTGKSPYERRLTTISCGNLETLILTETLSGSRPTYTVRINTELVKNQMQGRSGFGLLPSGSQIFNTGYRISGTVSAWAFPLHVFESIIKGKKQFARLSEMIEASYKLNVRMMRYGGTMYGRAHNPYFANDVFASAVGWKDRLEMPPKH